MFKYQYFLLTPLIFISLNSFCMDQEKLERSQDEESIKINGETKPLMGHINNTLMFNLNHMMYIDFIRYDNGKYIVISKGFPDLTENDFEQISNKNFVYVPFYTLEKRGGNLYKEIGAVVIGTKDEDKAKYIHFIAMNRMRKQQKMTKHSS